jgi:hypothetical protein
VTYGKGGDIIKVIMRKEPIPSTTPAARAMRVKRAKQFLQQLVQLSDQAKLDYGQIVERAKAFQREYPDSGTSLLERVWLEAYELDLANDCRSKKSLQPVSQNASKIKHLLHLLSPVADHTE